MLSLEGKQCGQSLLRERRSQPARRKHKAVAPGGLAAELPVLTEVLHSALPGTACDT